MEHSALSWLKQLPTERASALVRREALPWGNSGCKNSGIGVILFLTFIALAMHMEWGPERFRGSPDAREDLFPTASPLRTPTLPDAPHQIQDAQQTSDPLSSALEQLPPEPLPAPDQASPEPPSEPSSSSSPPALPPEPAEADPSLPEAPPSLPPPLPPPESPPPLSSSPPPPLHLLESDKSAVSPSDASGEAPPDATRAEDGRDSTVNATGSATGGDATAGVTGGDDTTGDATGGDEPGEEENMEIEMKVAAARGGGGRRWTSRDSPEYKAAVEQWKEGRRDMKRRQEAKEMQEEERLWQEIMHPKEEWRQAILNDLREAKQIITGEIPSEALPRPSVDEPRGFAYHDAEQFRRSYREMERRMKVFVYRYGRPPIFHAGPKLGIYASEGKIIRSLKLENGSPFVTADPKKANLFFLPFSVATCVKEFVNMSDGPERFVRYHARMGEFFSGYISEIARRDPYFNLSRATDHFYVSCHDWGAKTARFVPMLQHNAMKLVCNADVRTGDFLPGRDAGYLEVYIKKKYPPKNGGAKGRERKILAFFAGQKVGTVRPALMDYWGPRNDPDVQVFSRMSPEQKKEMTYEARMKRAKFCLCPAGHEVNSPRIVESMVHECIPVIIADGFHLPFSDVLRWESFSIRIEEADIPRIKDILLNVSDSTWDKLHRQLKDVRRHFIFNDPPQKYDAYHMGLHSIWLRRLIQVNGEPPWSRTLKL